MNWPQCDNGQSFIWYLKGLKPFKPIKLVHQLTHPKFGSCQTFTLATSNICPFFQFQESPPITALHPTPIHTWPRKWSRRPSHHLWWSSRSPTWLYWNQENPRLTSILWLESNPRLKPRMHHLMGGLHLIWLDPVIVGLLHRTDMRIKSRVSTTFEKVSDQSSKPTLFPQCS